MQCVRNRISYVCPQFLLYEPLCLDTREGVLANSGAQGHLLLAKSLLSKDYQLKSAFGG